MIFDVITIFPGIFDSYLNESIISRATQKGLLKINIHNLRDWAPDKHKTVDDRPYGGGIGMVMKVEPIYKAVEAIKRTKRLSSKKRKVILFTPRGKKFNQKYITESNIELLAYYELQPEIPESNWLPLVDKFVQHNIKDSVFQRIWICSATKNEIVFVYPPL